jgi:hypothetical protein
MAVLWVVAACSLIEGYQRFRGDWLEAASTSETSVNIYQTAQCNKPEDSHFPTRRHKNLKFCLIFGYVFFWVHKNWENCCDLFCSFYQKNYKLWKLHVFYTKLRQYLSHSHGIIPQRLCETNLMTSIRINEVYLRRTVYSRAFSV